MMTIEASPVDVFTVVGAAPQPHSHRDQNQKHTSNYISYHFKVETPDSTFVFHFPSNFSAELPFVPEILFGYDVVVMFVSFDFWLVKFYHQNTPEYTQVNPQTRIFVKLKFGFLVRNPPPPLLTTPL